MNHTFYATTQACYSLIKSHRKAKGLLLKIVSLFFLFLPTINYAQQYIRPSNSTARALNNFKETPGIKKGKHNSKKIKGAHKRPYNNKTEKEEVDPRPTLKDKIKKALANVPHKYSREHNHTEHYRPTYKHPKLDLLELISIKRFPTKQDESLGIKAFCRNTKERILITYTYYGFRQSYTEKIFCSKSSSILSTTIYYNLPLLINSLYTVLPYYKPTDWLLSYSQQGLPPKKYRKKEPSVLPVTVNTPYLGPYFGPPLHATYPDYPEEAPPTSTPAADLTQYPGYLLRGVYALLEEETERNAN